ncbi:hypothetical protein B2J88_14730 [Rhodococcus sp. SRB_17]|nr:hypothetical protein [Rhodococcus sp. SRB_17]
MLVERFQSVVKTDYHQFHIDPVQSDSIPDGIYPEFTLAVFGGQSIRVGVGIRVGPVNLVLEMHDSAPPYDGTDWEDVVEGDLFYDNPGGVIVWHFYSGGFEQAIPENVGETLTPAGEHRYRVRIHARGRDSEYDGPLFGDPVEDYLIQMWPTPEPERAREIKNLSGR